MLIFRLWGWVGFRSCGFFISAGMHGVFCLIIRLVSQWPYWFRPYVHSSFRLSVPSHINPYGSVIFTSATSDTVFYKQINFLCGLNPKSLKAILKHQKFSLRVLILKLQCYRERLHLSPLIWHTKTAFKSVFNAFLINFLLIIITIYFFRLAIW